MDNPPCTYGSPRYREHKIDKNYTLLKEMKSSDILVFYAGFSAGNSEGLIGLFCFAYFSIAEVFEYGSPNSVSAEDAHSISNNHHFRHERHNQLIIIGDPGKSKVFEKAVLLSSKEKDRDGANYRPCDVVRRILDYDKSLNLSSIRSFNDKSKEVNFKDYLDSNSGRNIQAVDLHSL